MQPPFGVGLAHGERALAAAVVAAYRLNIAQPWHQALRCRSGSDERVREQLGRRRPRFGRLDKRRREEVVKLVGPQRRNGELRRVGRRYEHEHAHWVLVVVRRVALGHLDAANAKRPYVSLLIVALAAALQNFGRDEVRGASDGLLALLVRRKAADHAEVGQLDVTPLGHQNVVSLNVAVDGVALVQVRQRAQRVLSHARDFVLVEAVRRRNAHDVVNAAHGALHGDPQLLLVLVVAVEARDALRVARRLRLELVERVAVALLRQALERERGARRAVHGAVHGAERARAEHLGELELAVRPRRLAQVLAQRHTCHGHVAARVAAFGRRVGVRRPRLNVVCGRRR
mmetsp:Transcript_23520/g.57468  ORF Transcript_23520/g.57468 Transcript_23520/m.57468 type:complete len:344 (+) Transcript_23520:1-1032(+)